MVMAFVCKIKKRFGKSDKFFQVSSLGLDLEFFVEASVWNF